MKLGQVTKVNAGYPFRGRIEPKEGGDAVVVQMKDIRADGQVDWFSCVVTHLDGKRAPQVLEPSDLLVTARGRHYRACLVGEGVRQLDKPVVAAPHFFVVRLAGGGQNAKPNKLLPEFLAWWLNQGPCQRYLEQHSEGSHTKSIRRNVLEEAAIAIPPTAQQQAILGLAQTLMRERQLLERLIANGEATMAAISNKLAHKSAR